MYSAIRGQLRPAIPAMIWPGFVDALVGVLLVLIFTISTFIIVQFFLRDELTGQGRALRLLEIRVGELAETLAFERIRSAEIEDELKSAFTDLAILREELTFERNSRSRAVERTQELSERLATSEDQAIALSLDLEAAGAEAQRTLLLLAAAEAAREKLTHEFDDALQALREESGDERERHSSEIEIEQLARAAAEKALSEQEEISRSDQERLAAVNLQLVALRSLLLTLQSQLDAAERRDEENQVVIRNLGSRLNAALAQKVSELSRYRSEFFGRMREALGNREDIRIVGDRFVFQSGILFATASAEIGAAGKADLSQIAIAIRDIAAGIPSDVSWLIRVDGHTDQRPLRSNFLYADNWELSQARALSVVRFFVEEQGLPAERFAVTGFGAHQPIDTGDTPEAHARNRRIELTLTRR